MTFPDAGGPSPGTPLGRDLFYEADIDGAIRRIPGEAGKMTLPPGVFGSSIPWDENRPSASRRFFRNY